MALTGGGLSQRGLPSLKKISSPSCSSSQLPTICSSRCGNSCPLPLSALKLSLAWVYKGLMKKFLAPMNSYMKLSCRVQEILFPFSYLLSMCIIILLTPLLQLSFGHGRGRCDIDVPVKAEHSMVSYSLCFNQLGDFITTNWKKKRLWWGWEM